MEQARLIVLGLLFCMFPSTVRIASEEPETPPTPTEMPVKEVTVFKDGHAFVLLEGDPIQRHQDPGSPYERI